MLVVEGQHAAVHEVLEEAVARLRVKLRAAPTAAPATTSTTTTHSSKSSSTRERHRSIVIVAEGHCGAVAGRGEHHSTGGGTGDGTW